MLERMTAKARRLPGGWVMPIGLAWVICELAMAWLLGREVMDTMHTHTRILSLVDDVLGVGLGVALARERRAGLIVVAVPAVALLATIVNSIAESDQGLDSSYPGLSFLAFGVGLAIPIVAGVLLGAIWVRRSKSKEPRRPRD